MRQNSGHFAYHLFILANTNDKHLSAKLHCLGCIVRLLPVTDFRVIPYMNSSVYTALYASALNRNLYRASSSCFDFVSSILWGRPALDEYRTHTRNELLRNVEAALEEIGDDNGLSTCSTCRKERNKTDRSSTTINRSMDHK